MKNCEKGLKNASKVASPCLLQACFLFAIDVFLHFDRRSELTPFIIMVSLIWRKVFLDSLTFSNSYGSRHYRDYTSTQSPKVTQVLFFCAHARQPGTFCLLEQTWRHRSSRRLFSLGLREKKTRNDPWTGNDPEIGPQMIPKRKWSPMWPANVQENPCPLE